MSMAAYSFSPVRFRVSPRPSTIIRSSKADGPLRRPVASPPPSLTPPPSLSPPPSLTPPPSLSTPTPVPPSPVKPVSQSQQSALLKATVPSTGAKSAVTLEYQRKVAKDLKEYFRQKKLEDESKGPFFGFMGKNEIANGRWAMFGFAVGLLTEYATGSDFVQQLKILFSNFGIVDLD